MSYRPRLTHKEIELIIAGLLSLKGQLMKRGWAFYEIELDLGRTITSGIGIPSSDLPEINKLIRKLRRIPSVSGSLARRKRRKTNT